MTLKILAIAIFFGFVISKSDAQYVVVNSGSNVVSSSYVASSYGGSSGYGSSGVIRSSYNRECFRRADCGFNQQCVMYDFSNYPSMWPPCPHYGYCECIEGTVMLSNGTCVPYVNLNLGDRCFNQINERYDVVMFRCDGTRIVCNLPYILTNGYCQMPVQTYPTYASIFYTQPRTPWIPPVAPIITTPPYVVVGYREACDSGRRICDAARGLCCTQRGPNNGYSQCLCCDKHNVYDDGLGYCRPRVYGDLCTETEECNSGLISNTGFECRLGRCRCVAGYDPVDNLYWNETSKTTYSRRICVVAGAVHWVPTGQSCTMYPDQWAQFNSTRVCHRRSFCHQCYRERNAAATGTGTAVMGTCRELTCNGEGDCQASASGIGMTCNRWQDVIDPPCDNGMCGCAGAGLYMDRFSRCAPYRKLQLGDRCLVPAGQGLHSWYLNNEDWDEAQECIDEGVGQGGYPGYSWGVLKCKLPLIEDYDGTCRRNDDLAGILYTTLNYMDQCDDADNRIPIARCDSNRGLVCRNKRCDCAGGSFGSVSVSYGGYVTGSTGGYSFWDGAKCRTRDYGDQCNQTAQCQSGSYYPGVSGGNAGICYQGLCTCGAGYTAVDIGSLTIDMGAYDVKQTSHRYCIRNFTIVPKGSECHLDPIAFMTRYQDTIRYGPSMICQPGTFCMRCPADFAPDDEARGICRSYNQPPPAAGQPCDGGLQVRQIAPQWTGWVETPVRTMWLAWSPPVVWNTWQPPFVWNTWNAWQPPVVWSAWQPPVVWQAYQPPVVWTAWQPPVVWTAWQPPVVWTAWQPPVVWTTWTPPVVWSTIQPPVVWTTWQPPVIWQAWQPPPVWTTYLPPVVWTTIIPPPVWVSWQPPPVWTAWVAPAPAWIAPPPVYIAPQPTWAPRVPPPPVPIMYAPPTQQLWNTWSAWCRNSAMPTTTIISNILLALASFSALFLAHRH